MHMCVCARMETWAWLVVSCISVLRQVTEEAATKAKLGGQETYRTATEYASAAYDKVHWSH